MKKTITISLLTIVSIIIVFTVGNSCRHESLGIDTMKAVCFQKDILPIFTSNCVITGCHDGLGEVHLLFKDYESIMKSVKPGDPLNSRAYSALTSIWGNGMPPKHPLDQQQRVKIFVWIKQGAKNDTTCKAYGSKDTTKIVVNDSACYQRDIFPILSNHCLMCHSSSSGIEDAPALDSYTKVSQLTVPGNPSNSSLYQSITGGENLMPPPDSTKLALTQVQINLIKQWITEGSKNNNCISNTCDTSNVTYSGTIVPLMQNNCIGCHGAGAAIDLSSYTLVKNRIDRIYIDINQGSGSDPMPKGGGKLSTCQISQVRIWMNNGFKN